jgi:CBS domain-containing protein
MPIASRSKTQEETMRAQELMTPKPACATPDDTVRRAAQVMADNDCGCLPVVESGAEGRVIGVITDRDIALRGVAKGKGPDTTVREVMTPDPACCRSDDDVRDVEQVMGDRQVRRVVIIDDDGRCTGIVSQADIARAAGRDVTDQDVARVVERISEPARSTSAHRYAM